VSGAPAANGIPSITLLNADRVAPTTRRHEIRHLPTDSVGQDYADQRYYSVGWGRFYMADPYVASGGASNPASWNRMTYVESDPVNRIDSRGLASCLVAQVSSTVGSSSSVTWVWETCPDIDLLSFEMQRSAQALPFAPPSGGLTGNIYGAPPAKLYGGTADQRDAVQGAFANAWDRIATNYNCRNYFGQGTAAFLRATVNQETGPSVEFAIQSELEFTLSNTEYRILPTQAPTWTGNSVSVVGAHTNSPFSVFINSHGPLFNQTVTNPANGASTILDLGTGLRGHAFGALLLLHELGHQLRMFGADAGDPMRNRNFTQQVLDNCFTRPGSSPGYQ
jgi:RHS repeat-associated protein